VTHQRALTTLVLVLRFGGVLLTFAFAAVFLPAHSMATVHGRLGMGEFPAAPLTDYLARSVSALYGFHGALLFIVAGDPVRYERIVLYLGVANIVFGLMLFGIDVHAGLPLWWTVVEGPPVVGLGVLVLYLRSRLGAEL